MKHIRTTKNRNTYDSSKRLDLKSTVSTQGKITTQIITFIGGTKKTIGGIISSSIAQGQFTKFNTTDGRLVMVNDQNVLCVEVFSGEESKTTSE